MKKQDIIDWVDHPDNHDQRAAGKQDFLRTGKYEPTRLRAVGISNGALKKQAGVFYRLHKSGGLEAVLPAIDELLTESKVYEGQILALFLLEKFHREFGRPLFERVDKWLDLVDYWAISDHFAINILGYFPLEEDWYRQRLWSWLQSDHYWRRRQSLTAYIKRARTHPELFEPILAAVEQLRDDGNYYIRKAIPWTLREGYRKHPQHQSRLFAFVTANIQYFSKTMLRETIRYLPGPQQDQLLQLYDSS